MARGLIGWAPPSPLLALTLSRVPLSLSAAFFPSGDDREWRRRPPVLHWVHPCLLVLVPLLEGDGVEWGSTSTYTGW